MANAYSPFDSYLGGPGPTGPPGVQGPQGEPGVPGATGMVGTLIADFTNRDPSQLPPDGLIPADWEAPGIPLASFQMVYLQSLYYTVNEHFYVFVTTTLEPSGWVDIGEIVGDPGPVGPAGPPGPTGPQGESGGASTELSPPVNPNKGQFWFDPNGLQLYVWYDDGNSAQWVVAINQVATMTAIANLNRRTNKAIADLNKKIHELEKAAGLAE